MQLIDGADLSVLAEEERGGNFTGERLKQLRPQTYCEIITAIAGGASMRSIARVYHVSTNTVSAVVRSEASAIEAVKKEIGARATAVHRLAWERLEEDLLDNEVMKKTSARDKAIITGITGDRLALADGMPTQIVEHQHISAEDINAQFSEVIDITDSGVGSGEQKGARILETEVSEPVADCGGEPASVHPGSRAADCGGEPVAGVEPGPSSLDQGSNNP